MRPSPGQARRLPIPAPPALNETTESYLRRLANVNHVTLGELKLHLGLSATSGVGDLPPHNLRRLATITGYSSAQLARALPDLGNRFLNRDLFSLPSRDACPACTRRHRGGTVTRYFPHHAHVCRRHRLWIREPTYQGTFLDISPVPAILTAQARHRRLARRFGPIPTEHAYTTARDSWQYVRQLTKTVDTALGIFCPGRTRIFGDDPAFLAATYPDVVSLTVLLVSPYWRQLAADPDTRHRFYAEAGWRTRRDRRYRPMRNDTLHEWVEDLTAEHRTDGDNWSDLLRRMRVWHLG
ncbi:TniQ family protein [Nocardia exalbida]|uniref:TniQ family protein n=1 Tax=Nocardia exalbida TaxID=290231 RepID=UPI0002DB1278|nr:TniQ family protein [Nocardia exalbida]